MLARRYTAADAGKWDEFCGGTFMATFLHTRRFLSYHEHRFSDQSLILEEDGKWLGLLPAALDPGDLGHVVSHPGITYGGMLHQGGLLGARMIEAFEVACRHFVEQGCSRFTYKAIPRIYHRSPAEDDLYALFRLGARRIRCDLSSAVELAHRLPASERRRRSIRKALKAGVQISEGRQFAPALWDVLQENLARKHGLKPVHTLAEIELLAQRFPDNIHFVVGLLDGQVEAGIVLFITPSAHHSQYTAASPAANNACALDAIFEHCLAAKATGGVRWFDFGISTELNGTVLNEGLYRFKSEFGGTGVAHEFYELKIR